MAAIDWYQMLINSQISLDDYCKFAGIEIGSAKYLEIAEVLESRRVLEVVPKKSTFGDLSNAINNAPRNEAANSVIDSLNDAIKSDGASSIIDGVNKSTEHNVNRIYSKSGEIIEFYVDSAERTNSPNGAYDGGLTISEPINAVLDEAGDVVLERGAGRNKLGQLVDGFIGTVSSVFAAVGILNCVGKLISKPLYETSVKLGYDMYQLDPDYFDNIYAGDTSAVAMIQNVIWNLNPVNNELTMYIDDRYVAGVIGYLCKKGWFDTDDKTVSLPAGSSVSTEGLYYPITTTTEMYDEIHELTDQLEPKVIAYRVANIASGKLIYERWSIPHEDDEDFTIIVPWYVSKIDDTAIPTYESVTYVNNERLPATHETGRLCVDDKAFWSFEVEGKPIFVGRPRIFSWPSDATGTIPLYEDYNSKISFVFSGESEEVLEDLLKRAAYIALYGDVSGHSVYQGVRNQPQANVFTLPGTNASYDMIQRELQFDYPEIWTKALTRGVLDDEGSIKTRTYIPIPAPWGSPVTSPDIETGKSRQTDLSPSTGTLPSEVADSLPNTASQPNNTTKNPPKEDAGVSPPVIPPLGSASAMWTVYAPSQAQLNSFGSWLWSSNFIDQIAKLFNDPMQAIIGVHKIYCSPSIAGSKNIKVGYLDSGVSSAYVSNQYATVDCGSITVDEYFGNVFDYSPYTSINLYLPFIGIVQLDPADIMRSTINVTYGIDVFTGDCLAKVNVSRGSAGGILYTYSGNCAVKYPVSSGSYMSILGYAAGAAATIYTGNIGMMGAVSGIFGNRPTVQHSGSFTGNSGATGPKTPYLIISRPQSALALNFNSYEGYPVNTTQKIGDCKGFIRVREIHLTNISATDDELTMIEELLKDGVIVQSD